MSVETGDRRPQDCEQPGARLAW